MMTPAQNRDIAAWIRKWAYCPRAIAAAHQDPASRESAAGLAIAEWVDAHERLPEGDQELQTVFQRFLTILRNETRAAAGAFVRVGSPEAYAAVQSPVLLDREELECRASTPTSECDPDSDTAQTDLAVLARTVAARVRTLASEHAARLLAAARRSHGEDGVLLLAQALSSLPESQIGQVLSALDEAADQREQIAVAPSPLERRALTPSGRRSRRMRHRDFELDRLHRAVEEARRFLGDPLP